MRTSKANTETTLTVELTAQDMLEIIQGIPASPIPKDWKYYSIEVQGNGVSKGATLTIKCSQVGHSIPKQPNQ